MSRKSNLFGKVGRLSPFLLHPIRRLVLTHKRNKLLALAASLLVVAPVSSGAPLNIYSVNYPLKYFAKRIAAEHAVISFPAPRAVDPAFWWPDAKAVGAYQTADLILLNGAGYAKWVNRVTLPQLRLVNTSAAFREHYISVDETVTHRHGPGGDHVHAGTAFNTWLDFDQAAQQAQAVAAAIERKRPASHATFDSNYEALAKELRDLDAQLASIVAQSANQPLIASHPVYQYMARRYALNVRSVLWEPDEMPSERQWAELAVLLQQHPAKWMIWESEPDAEVVERLRSMGLGTVVFDPCGNVPSQGDFMSVMRQNLQNLEVAFRQYAEPSDL
ncbi:MAG: zinc ABC transporter substrate-binding protein [Pseudomonadota bacterium]|nr:MAG: zinc ABC transporter substrate-binding protein [Pseudomonadota bacterium]